MYMVLPSRKSVQQILPLLIPRNSTFLPFNTFNWFFFFFFHGSSKCYLSEGRTKLIPQKWRGWFYGGKDQNTKKSLDHKFTSPPPKKKIPYRTTRPKYATTTTNLQLHQAAQDNTCRIFLPQKIPESKISNPKNPSIIAVTWNPEYFHWVFVQPQVSSPNVLLMTYFITTKKILKYEAESERPTSKRETTTNWKRTK